MDRSSDLSGIAAMLAATAFFVVGDSFMKLVTEDLPPFEVLFLRSIAASLACAVLVALRGDRRGISGVLDLRALLRAAGETLCTLCYIVALARMPIADVIAILQTGPLILILGAAFLLREKIGPARVALALVGFAGALMVAQPSANGGAARCPARLRGCAARRCARSRRAWSAHQHSGDGGDPCDHAHDDCGGGRDVARSGDMGRADWSPSRLSRRRRVVRRLRAFRAPARLLAWPYQHGRALLLQLRTLGGRIWPIRLGRVAERSGPRRDCLDRRERLCHCRARPATWSQGDRAIGRAMITLITNRASARESVR